MNGTRTVVWLGLGFAAVGITALGVLGGWALSYSSLPPSGGGWRCYRDGILASWILALVVASPYFIAKGVTHLSRWLTSLISN